jgi:hypothetical protein
MSLLSAVSVSHRRKASCQWPQNCMLTVHGLALLHLSESRTVSDRDTPLVRVALGHGGTTTVLQISRIRPHYPRAADISRWLLL